MVGFRGGATPTTLPLLSKEGNNPRTIFMLCGQQGSHGQRFPDRGFLIVITNPRSIENRLTVGTRYPLVAPASCRQMPPGRRRSSRGGTQMTQVGMCAVE